MSRRRALAAREQEFFQSVEGECHGEQYKRNEQAKKEHRATLSRSYPPRHARPKSVDYSRTSIMYPLEGHRTL